MIAVFETFASYPQYESWDSLGRLGWIRKKRKSTHTYPIKRP